MVSVAGLRKPRDLGRKIQHKYEAFYEHVLSISSLSIDHISTVDDERGSLHEAGLATAKKQYAIGNFLRCPRAIHRCDGDGRSKYVHLRSGHGSV